MLHDANGFHAVGPWGVHPCHPCRDGALRVFTDQAKIACTNREAPGESHNG